MQERVYQARLIKHIRRMFPGCVVLKNDTDYIQGIPDLTILYKDGWAVLEVKANSRASFQPNQEYYLEVLNDMGFAACIFPENEEDVLYELQQAFEPRRNSRIP